MIIKTIKRKCVQSVLKTLTAKCFPKMESLQLAERKKNQAQGSKA